MPRLDMWTSASNIWWNNRQAFCSSRPSLICYDLYLAKNVIEMNVTNLP